MLEIKNVHKTFNKGTINEKKALNGVNLHLEDFASTLTQIREMGPENLQLSTW